MAKIITHSGFAHLDDFLSACLILYKDSEVDTILRQAEITEEELNDSAIWKVDIGQRHDPDLRAFDHHQEDMNDCSFSLLLKQWSIWERANTVYSWIPTLVEIDTSGLSAVLKPKGLSHNDYFQLDTFIKTAYLEIFQKYKRIEKNNKKHTLMFLNMKRIGKEFFDGITTYEHILNDFGSNLDVQIMSKQKIEDPKGILVLLYLTDRPKYCVHLTILLKKFKTEHFPDYKKGWITAFTYDRPLNTISLKRHGKGDHIDLYRLSGLKKTHFAHRKGFVATVKRMSTEELYSYIQHALI